MTSQSSDRLVLFVPAPSTRLNSIRPGSAIVGSPAKTGHWTIDFEGNIHHAVNLSTFEERIQSAAGRHVQRYPTSARMAVDVDDLIAVGHVRNCEALNAWILADLSEPETLAAWIAPEALPRIGGSKATWDRAAALVFSRDRTSIVYAARNTRSDLTAVAYATLTTMDPTLQPPI